MASAPEFWRLGRTAARRDPFGPSKIGGLLSLGRWKPMSGGLFVQLSGGFPISRVSELSRVTFG